jgi:trans-aconitate methyltransferase
MTYEWNAVEYHRLSRPQTEWGQRVLGRLELRGDEQLVDAGCGTGRLTAQILEKLPAGRVVCLDRSFQMLTVARDHLAPRFGGRVVFIEADLTALPLRACTDIVFSTATFHWVLDHPRLFRQIFEALRPNGLLIAQCGGAGNLDQLHARATVLADSPQFRNFFARWSPPWEFADSATTRARLEAAGFVEVTTDIEDAPTFLGGAREYADFVTTVVFRQHLACIPDERAQREFIETLTRQAATDDPPFYLDYRRLNIRARKPR